jgi:hypothetical protein
LDIPDLNEVRDAILSIAITRACVLETFVNCSARSAAFP